MYPLVIYISTRPFRIPSNIYDGALTGSPVQGGHWILEILEILEYT